MSREDVDQALPAAARGERDALALLWQAHQPALLRYLRGRGMRDAEDLATQVWMDVARGLPRFRGGGDDFRGWLFTIAYRRTIDERRRGGRRADAMAAIRPVDEAVPGADAEFDVQDSLSRALALVTHLPDQMRDVVLLRVVADLSVADTAEVLSLRAGNVRVLMHRGLARLEQLLRDDDAEAVTMRGSSTMRRST